MNHTHFRFEKQLWDLLENTVINKKHKSFIHIQVLQYRILECIAEKCEENMRKVYPRIQIEIC